MEFTLWVLFLASKKKHSETLKQVLCYNPVILKHPLSTRRKQANKCTRYNTAEYYYVLVVAPRFRIAPAAQLYNGKSTYTHPLYPRRQLACAYRMVLHAPCAPTKKPSQTGQSQRAHRKLLDPAYVYTYYHTLQKEISRENGASLRQLACVYCMLRHAPCTPTKKAGTKRNRLNAPTPTGKLFVLTSPRILQKGQKKYP